MTNCAFTSRIRCHSHAALEGSQARCVDQPALDTVLDPVPPNALAEKERAVEVDLHDLVKVFLGKVHRRVPLHDAGVVDKYVDLVSRSDLGD